MLLYSVTCSHPHLTFLLLLHIYIHAHTLSPPKHQLHKHIHQLAPGLNQMASSTTFLVLTTLLALLSWRVIASDPSPLQDFCVADKDSQGTHIQIQITKNRMISYVWFICICTNHCYRYSNICGTSYYYVSHISSIIFPPQCSACQWLCLQRHKGCQGRRLLPSSKPRQAKGHDS